MTRHTNKKILAKGIKYLAIAVPFIFLGPYLLTMSFLNKEHWVFYVFIVFGLIFGAGAIFLIFKAIKTIVKAIFD